MGILKMKFLPLALSAAFLVTSVLPSQAFTRIPVPTQAERVSDDVQNVQYRDRDDWRRHHRGNDWRRDRMIRRDNGAYYNGHRGYRERRQGYRQHNGMWFPLAAFATGAIIGGAVADRPVRYGGSHVQWCSERYRSYRASDNSFQPNSGRRQQCNSPY